MKRAVVFAMIVLCAGTIAASQAPNPPRDTAAAPVGTASVSGVVVDDEGKPMRRVSVYFEGDARANRTAITDDLGKFAVTSMPAARYTIRAEKGGYPPVNYGAKRPGRPGAGLFLKEGDKVENITLRMARGAVITGRIFDDRGRPLPGASVTAYRVETTLAGDFDVRPVVNSGSAFPVTDDRGAYRFYGLAAGEYIVGTSPFFFGLSEAVRVPTDAEVRAAFGLSQQTSRAISTEARPATTAAPRTVNYAPVFFGDVVDPQASSRIRLVPGEERAGVDLHLTLQPVASVAGSIVGPDPLPNIRLELQRMTATSGMGSTQVTQPMAGGILQFRNLAPGDYNLVARTTSGPSLYAEAPLAIAGRDITGLRLDLQPAMSITGRIVFQGSALPPPDPARVTVLTLPLTGTGRSVTSSAAEVTPEFAFTFNSVIPGRFSFTGATRDTPRPGAPSWTLASVMLGDRDVTDLPVEIRNGEALPPVTMTFTDSPSELSGTLMTADGKPGTDFFVVAFASDERHWLFRARRIKSTRPDGNGRYSFPGLPPGKYRVAAITELESGDLTSLTFLRELVGASAEVVVGVGEKKVFDLKLGVAR